MTSNLSTFRKKEGKHHASQTENSLTSDLRPSRWSEGKRITKGD